MPEFSKTDCRHMARALQLARRGLYTAHPNPRVGCVIAAGGDVVGEGWHEVAGQAHAEVNALQMAGGRAAGATAYVTLEPCAHHGRTAPCSEALIRARVASVVAAMQDPFPEVAGQGIDGLRAAGIEVRVGLFAAEARRLNEGFLSRVERGRPFVRLKTAASLDGGTAMTGGESQWITGDAARRDVQRLRAASGAVMTGIGTVLGDDPSLTVRDAALATRQPLRVVIDSRLRMPATARMLGLDGRTVVFCADDTERAALEAAGAEVLKVAGDDGRVALEAALGELGRLGINDLLVEAGPGLSGALLDAGLIDELVIYQAPHIMGSEVRPMFETPGWRTLGQRRALEVMDIRRIGADFRITARPTAAA